MATFNAGSRLNPSNLLEIEEYWNEDLREQYGEAGGLIGTKSYYENTSANPALYQGDDHCWY
jgi:hypothetical protein